MVNCPFFIEPELEEIEFDSVGSCKLSGGSCWFDKHKAKLKDYGKCYEYEQRKKHGEFPEVIK